MTKYVSFTVLLLLAVCLAMATLPGTVAATESTVAELPTASQEDIAVQEALAAFEPDENSANVQEGGTCTLSVSGVSGTITWVSGNTAVATVSSAGVVTGVKAGTTTVTASVGGTVRQTFTVYVRIADGMYYISRSGLRLGTSGLVDDNTRAYLYSPSSAGFSQLKQLWKITYLSTGYYSIRPMYKLDMGLHSTSNLADIVGISTNETLSSIGLENCWGIEYANGGYVFKYTNSSSMALYSVSASAGSAVTTSTYSSGASGFHWTIQKVTNISNQTVLINTETGASAVNTTRYIDPGETATLSDLGIAAAFVSSSSNSQSITWTSSSSSNVTVNSAGAVTGITPGGTATITATHYHNGSGYQAQYTVKVKPFPDGTYFVRNPASERYLQIDNNDSTNNYSTSGAAMEQWYYTGDPYQKWNITFRGDGYYSIISAQSGLALSVASSQTGSANVNLIQETYYGYDRQKWAITQTDSGYYKIKPKSSEAASSDLVMAVGSSDVGVVDGVKIQQRTFSNDTTYIDEWQICTAVDFGFSTDDFGRGCGHDTLHSYYYATTFYSNLSSSAGGGPFSKTHHYNQGTTYSANGNDFGTNGAMSNSIDFMIYIGHGHAAHDSEGNHLHYDCGRLGTPHEYDQSTKTYPYCNSAGNVYSKGMRFGSSSSDLRWVWLYTCHFLGTNDYVTDADLKDMMNGAHIVMGYATQSFLCEPNVQLFSQYLYDGEPIIDSYFQAGRLGEAPHATDNHLQKAMYIPQALNETIYSPQIHYTRDTSNVLIDTSYIKGADS